jgi:hypothetical protein
MANHADLPSSEWHPAYPPGADVAASGDVFLSDGVGAGSWSSLSSLIDAEKAYAQISSNSQTLSVPQATDAALNTAVDYIDLTSLSMWVSDGSKDITVDNVNGAFTFTKAGVYMLHMWIDHSVDGTSNANIAFKFSINGTLASNKMVSTSDFSGDISNSSASSILFTVSAGDVVKAHVACTDSRTLTIHSAHINTVRL